MSGLNHVCTNSFVAFVILTYNVVFGFPLIYLLQCTGNAMFVLL